VTVPFALSVTHFINSVGAKAGFAAIIGLAILVLLFFAQMRETATLREQAVEAAERMRQLEGRLMQVLRAQAAAAQPPPAQAQPAQQLRQVPAPSRPAGVPEPVAAPVGAPVGAAPARPPVAQPLRIAPAGVGAPALTAATRLIPIDESAGGVAVAPPPPAPAPFDVDGAPAPATAAGGANGTSAPRAGDPLAPPPGVPPRVQIRPGAAAPPPGRRPGGSGLESFDEPPRSVGRTVLYGIGGLIVVVGIVVGLLALTGGSSGTPRTAPARTTNAPTSTRRGHHKGTAAVDPANVTVAVLNGTATYHLANDISQRLTVVHFKHGYIGNAADQTHSTTTVQYLPGNANRLAALAVAQKLGVPAAAVTPIDASTQSLACPSTATCPPTGVVVTVGADLSGTATGAASTPASTPASSGAGAVTSTGAVGTTTGTGTTP
jgi:hypothetical protein